MVDTRKEENFRRPQFEIIQAGNVTTVVADLPGVEREGLEIGVEAGQLTILARPSDRTPSGLTALRQEFEPAAFRASFRIPETLDADAAEALLKDGVLRLSIPVRKQNGVRKISVRSEQ